ncbi:UNVERIFIED_CONTAM: hypothetical protein NCL1_49604 [Trichonephila clavipes]
MTNLGLKTLNVVPCYCHHTLPTMWEALNTNNFCICHTMCESGHLLAHSIRNILSCCKPSTTYWFLNLGNEIKVTGRISSLENGYFDVSTLLNTGYFHLPRHSPTDFTALAALLPAITESSVVLHTRYACKTSTRHIYVCDLFTYLQGKNSCHDLCPNPSISHVPKRIFLLLGNTYVGLQWLILHSKRTC